MSADLLGAVVGVASFALGVLVGAVSVWGYHRRRAAAPAARVRAALEQMREVFEATGGLVAQGFGAFGVDGLAARRAVEDAIPLVRDTRLRGHLEGLLRAFDAAQGEAIKEPAAWHFAAAAFESTGPRADARRLLGAALERLTVLERRAAGL